MSEPLTIEAIKGLTRGQLLTHVRDLLLRRAGRVRELEEGLIRIGQSHVWLSDNAESHDAMCAAALVFDHIIARGKDQATRGLKIDPMIEAIVGFVRSSFISEMMRRDAPPSVADAES